MIGEQGQEIGAVAAQQSTTGEWMASTVEVMFMANPKNAHYAISDAHNAAIAAAWRKGHADAQAPALDRIKELHNQLAAEREKHESCVAWEDHNETLDELQKCREQLAAQREKSVNDELLENVKLKAQLAAVKVALATEQQNADSFCRQLAAEREAKLGWRKIAERQTTDAEQLREQLAAERERADKAAARAESEQIQADVWRRQAEGYCDDAHKARQQLAAERERRETAEINRDAWRQDAAKFREQLAALEERLKQ